MPEPIVPREFGAPLGMIALAGDLVIVAGQVGAKGTSEIAGRRSSRRTTAAKRASVKRRRR